MFLEKQNRGCHYQCKHLIIRNANSDLDFYNLVIYNLDFHNLVFCKL